MNITLNIEAETPEEMKKAIGELAGALSTATISTTPSGKSDTPKQPKSASAKSTATPEPAAGQALEQAAESTPATPTPAEPATPTTPTVSLEEVRAKLAALSQSGKQAQVKELITKFGASKLTDIPAEKYSELLEEAGKIV
ncbi:hypothetical protein FDZ73_19595 [bacterium]|nr:MAG: hypothetical protein FDZ73_19595 [bacterium]